MRGLFCLLDFSLIWGSGNRGQQAQSAISRELQIPVPETQSAFLPLAQQTLRRRDERLQSRSFAPLESFADTQPQLQPALLRLSAIISQ